MLEPIQVKALDNYKIWIKYSDGVQGEVDLSRFVGKGVFSSWNDYDEFKKVHIENGAIAWNDQIDLCSDSIYLEITDQKPEELFPKLANNKINA